MKITFHPLELARQTHYYQFRVKGGRGRGRRRKKKKHGKKSTPSISFNSKEEEESLPGNPSKGAFRRRGWARASYIQPSARERERERKQPGIFTLRLLLLLLLLLPRAAPLTKSRDLFPYKYVISRRARAGGRLLIPSSSIFSHYF